MASPFDQYELLRQLLESEAQAENSTSPQPPPEDVAHPEWDMFMSMPEPSGAHLQNEIVPEENAITQEPFFEPPSASPMQPSVQLSPPTILPVPTSSTSATVPIFLFQTENLIQASEQANHVLDTYFQQPHQLQQRTLLRNCVHSDRFEGDVQEPATTKGEFILHGFLELIKKSPNATYRCLFDDCGRSIKRQDRALGHVRMHLGLRPYSCNGKCGNIFCEENFSCRSYLRSHITREKDRCENCGKTILRQNMKRHQKSCPKKPA